MNKVSEILNFWFEGVDDTTTIDKRKDPFYKWFNSTPKLDQEIKERFEGDLIRVAQGGYQDWGDTPQVRFARILLLDQFSRNIYRNTPKMYAFDDLALALAQRTVEDGMEGELPLIQRMFVYMPFHHSEDIRMQELSVKYFGSLVEACQRINPENLSYYEYNFNYSQKHYQIIQAQGRFPHRDKIKQ